MVKHLRYRDVLYLLVAGWLIIGMLKGISYLGRASPLDVFLLYFFAAAIALVWAIAYRFIRNSNNCDGLGASLAVLLAISMRIVIVLIILFCFYYLPEV